MRLRSFLVLSVGLLLSWGKTWVQAQDIPDNLQSQDVGPSQHTHGNTMVGETSSIPLTPQQKRDSARRAKLASLSKNSGESEIYYDLYMQCGLPRFDTMSFPLDGFQNFNPIHQQNDFRADRGSMGMPDQLLEFVPRYVSGFSSRQNPYSAWFYTQYNTPFIQTKTPYTYLYFVNNFGKDFNFFNAVHNQNVARGLNMGVDFRVYDVYGLYVNNRSNQYNTRFSGNYISRDAKYRLLFGYIFNAVTVGENGGIANDSLFTHNVETNRLRIPVYMEKGWNRWREHRAFIKQVYHFYDNQKDSIAENNRSYGYLAHEFDITDLKTSYNDETTIDGGMYRNFYLDPLKSSDTTTTTKITNRVYYSTYDMEYIPFGYAFKLAGGFKNEVILFKDDMRREQFVQWFPFAQMQIDFADRFVVDAYADFGFGGYNQFDFTGRAMLKYLFKDDNERTLSKRDGVEVMLGVNRYSPDWIYTYHASNHFYWDNSWNKSLDAYVQVKFAYKGWWVRARGSLLQNYTFLKEDGPVQADQEFFVVNVVGGKKLRIGKYFGMDNLLMFAYSSNQDYMHLPLFSMQESLYANIPIRNLAVLQVGLEVLYNTSYYGDAYNPALTSYYWQDEVKTGNFVYLNAFINFQVKRANIFFKGMNLAQGLFGYNYIQTPHYPLADRCFRFGISWRFFD